MVGGAIEFSENSMCLVSGISVHSLVIEDSLRRWWFSSSFVRWIPWGLWFQSH